MYEINVSYKGTHFFATATRSLTHLEKANDMYKLFELLFPVEDGYHLSLQRRESIGHYIKTNDPMYREHLLFDGEPS